MRPVSQVKTNLAFEKNQDDSRALRRTSGAFATTPNVQAGD
jgi:hypothetical protein